MPRLCPTRVGQMATKKEQVVALERVELSDSEDDFEYAEVDVSDEDDVINGGDDDDLLASLKKKQQAVSFKAGTGGAGSSVASTGSNSGNYGSSAGGAASGSGNRGRPGVAETVSHPVAVDDFVRNFLLNAGLHRSLDAFNTEWYEMKARGLLSEAANTPDIYVRNAALEDEIRKLRDELQVWLTRFVLPLRASS